MVQTVDDIHQRRLACTILAQQGQDLPFIQGQIDVVIGQDARKSLGHANDFKDNFV